MKRLHEPPEPGPWLNNLPKSNQRFEVPPDSGRRHNVLPEPSPGLSAAMPWVIVGQKCALKGRDHEPIAREIGRFGNDKELDLMNNRFWIEASGALSGRGDFIGCLTRASCMDTMPWAVFFWPYRPLVMP